MPLSEFVHISTPTTPLWASPSEFHKAIYGDRCLKCGYRFLNIQMKAISCDNCGHEWPRGMEAAPAIVLTDCLKSFISRRIKHHSHGHYSHAMLLLPDGRLISQDWTLREAVWATYLDGAHRVKLWTSPAWRKPRAVRDITKAVNAYLDAPRERRRYDWLGIIGQYLGLRWINFGHRTYCSEWCAAVLRKAGVPECPPDRYPSPADLDSWCKSNPRCEVAALYDPTW